MTKISNVTAIILAGGRSSRMGGEDKSLLPVKGVPLIQHIASQITPFFNETIIGANDIGNYQFLNLKIVPDIEVGKGPLMGIYSCLKSSSNDLCFVTGCDIPEININLIERMLKVSDDFEIVMPVNWSKEFEPLFALYRKSIVEKAEKILRGDGRKIVELLKVCSVKYLDFDGEGWYSNINTREDFDHYIKGIYNSKGN